MGYLRAEQKPIHLLSLHIENCTIKKEYTSEIIRSLKTNTTLKRLSLVNQMNM